MAATSSTDKAYPGDVVTLTSTWVNAANTATTPGTLSLFVKDPTGAVTENVYGTDPGFSNPAVGTLQFNQSIPRNNAYAGPWYFRWEATGALVKVQLDSFEVTADPVLNG